MKKPTVVLIGRFSPPTSAHYELAHKAQAFAREEDNAKKEYSPLPFIIVVDGKETRRDKIRNPLTAQQSVQFLQASGKCNGCKIIVADNAIDGFNKVRKMGYEPTALAVGSDRAPGYIKLLNNQEPSVKHIVIPGISDREDNSLSAMNTILARMRKDQDIDMDEISSSLAKHAAEEGYFPEFAKIVGLEDKLGLAKKLYNIVQHSLQQDETK